MKVQIPFNFCPFYVKGKRQTARMSDRVQGTCTVALTVLVPSPI